MPNCRDIFLDSSEDVFASQSHQKNEPVVEIILNHLLKANPQSFAELEKIKNQICGKFHISTLQNLEIIGFAKKSNITLPVTLENLLRKRAVRTLSGVAVITVLTKPYPCPGQCVFCPQEIVSVEGKTLFEYDQKNQNSKIKIPKKYSKPGETVMPKSYFSNEPAASRALLNSFDPFAQVVNRLKSLETTGHDLSKIELIILGGTFSSLPKQYRTWFVTRLFQALNGDSFDQKTTLVAAQKKNERSEHRAIALVVETRPDKVDLEEIRYLRRLGCTKVELGVQSTDDDVLRLCKRGHGRSESIRAIQLLRDSGFKIGIHIMPGLPGSDEQKDIKTFEELFRKPDFQPDFLKIYPCSVVPFSELELWEKDGRFIPLSAEKLFPLLIALKKLCPPWVRISRLVRDIPATSIIAGSKITNMRQLILAHLEKSGNKCRCIRCREIQKQKFNPKNINLIRRDYDASGGKEIFLSYETEDDKLLALLRLRMPSGYFNGQYEINFRALNKAAIIREIHTYGLMVPVGIKIANKAQHVGWGSKLILEAERIVTEEFGIYKLAVISGIGVKEYWRQRGYRDDGYYLVKNLKKS